MHENFHNFEAYDRKLRLPCSSPKLGSDDVDEVREQAREIAARAEAAS
jgi:hypothetical protein